MTDNDKALESLKRFGYAPGGYMCVCLECRDEFDGDKRATMCRECAEKAETSRLDALANEADTTALPCPFCGQPPQVDRDSDYKQYAIYCKSADCPGAHLHVHKTSQAAREAWNTRHQAALPKGQEEDGGDYNSVPLPVGRSMVAIDAKRFAEMQAAIETLTRENAELKFLNAEHETFAAECQRQHAAQLSTLRRAVIEIVDAYIERPVGGDAQDTQAAFDAGMNYTTGGTDNAAAIKDAILAIPDATGTKEGGR